MKRAVAYLLFSLWLLDAVAQKQTSAPLVIPGITDSIQIASWQYFEAIHSSRKDTAQAFFLLKNAARVFKKNNLAIDEGRCRLKIADIYFDSAQYGKSFGSYQAAQELFFDKSQRDYYYATLGVAKSQFHRGLYRFSVKAFAEVIEYSYKIGDDTLRASASEYLGDIFFIFQSNADSKNYLTSAFIAQTNLHDDPGSLRVADKLFTLEYIDHKYDSALAYSDFSISIADKLNKKRQLRDYSLNRIAALIRLKRLEEAKQDLNKFVNVQFVNWDLNSRIKYESVLGNYYMAMRENERALSIYDSALKHASMPNTPELQAVVYSNMADSYAEQANYEKAYECNLKYQHMMSDFFSNSISNLSKIEGLIKEDVYNSRIRYLSSINKIKELQLLHDKDAKENLELENRFKDSILQKEKLLSAALELENSYKTKQLESGQQLTATLNRESQQQKQQLKRERNLQGALIAGLSCMLFLGALAAYQYRRTRLKNRIIEKQSADLKILVKEIHHRVKNNLQIISSLLDIQSMTVENQQALESIRGSKNRVQSMAIIHRFLYHEDNIRGIMIEDYLKNLSENLFSSYSINPDKVKLVTDIDRLNLDVDTMIPLGLIINELISNSLKYAFADNETGVLSISLKERDKNLHLQVRDTGVGFPSPEALQQRQTFGLQLISAFAQKLKAQLEYYNDNGAVVCMRIKKYKLA